MRILSLRSGMTERQRIVEDIVICTHADDRSRVGLVPGWKLSGDQEQRSKRYECLAEVIQVGLKPNKKCPSKRWCCQHVLHLGGLCQRRCCDHAASDFREGRGALRTFGMQTIDSIDHAKWQNPQNSFCYVFVCRICFLHMCRFQSKPLKGMCRSRHQLLKMEKRDMVLTRLAL